MASDPRAAHVLLAQAALARGDVAEAANEIGSIDRPHPADLVLMAEIAARRQHFDDALSRLDQAEAMARQNGEGEVYRLQFVRGDIYAQMSRNTDAIASFQKEIAAFPNDLDAYARLAIVFAISGDGTAAERVLNQMVSANPTPVARRLAAETRQALR